MQILGIDFTSSPSARKKITCVRANLQGDELRVVDLERWTDFGAFESALIQPGPWIAGIDFPFGQSTRFIENIGWPPNWRDYVAHVGKLSRKEFREQLDAYRNARPPGDKEHRRATDIAAGAISPQKLFGVPVGLMFFEGAPRLLASGATVPGVVEGPSDRIVVEAYPGVLARRLIGRVSYKNDSKKKQTLAQLGARRDVLLRLKADDMLATHGVRVVADDDIADDPCGDDLDALLCAVQAAAAWIARDQGFGAPAGLDSNEGWIAEPTIYDAGPGAQAVPMKYDLIGDIHGYSKPLIELLEKLDYRRVDGVYRHPERQVVFLGDFIDRGPDQRGVIDIVRPMIDSGAALSVMGNHEYNAIAWFTPDPDRPGKYLREHSDRNRRQTRAFLAAYEDKDDHADLIRWFRTLPMWLDLPGLRVVHACWDESLMQLLADKYPSLNSFLDDDLLVAAAREGSDEFEAVETVLKGREIRMPHGQSFPDKDGNPRHHIRLRWWDASARTYRDAFLGPDSALSHIPEDPIDVDHLIQYSSDAPPVFVGHYWMDTEPQLLAPNVACLDYSVAAKQGGKLVAYRWDGERQLSDDKFVYVVKGPD